ncbi:MAG: pilus (MSHA type) biogenesis protein MshL [Epsilonproteobacteria bacterium]|nr:MAG: pilus (MSHA type) biogenesis protein MshL [Campylobacterota bacterium]
MNKLQNKAKVLLVFILALGVNYAYAGKCSTKLFTATIDSNLAISDVVENLASTCDLSIVIKDDAAKQRLNKKLYYVKLKNATLKGFLDTVLTDNDLNYELKGSKLEISYFITRTFKVHYIAGTRTGKSSAQITIANSNNSAASGNGGEGEDQGGSETGIAIESNDDFKFWTTIKEELQHILVSATDDTLHFTRSGDGWVAPDGKVWDFNPLEPVINKEAGMITVTGTSRQMKRVAKYIKALESQIRAQVIIDVRILAVTFDDSTTSGVDWGQIYSLQNFTINSLLATQKDVTELTYDLADGVTDYTIERGSGTFKGKALIATGSTQVSDVVRFLSTQGDVQAISSPRVMTMNNQPALISVGQELFYKIKSSTTTNSGGGSSSAEGELVDSVFAGILLDITPEIDEETGMITLKINPSISDTVGTVTAGEDGIRSIPPDLSRRQISSVIKVKDGEHAILGGLITSRSGTQSSQVPLLGDLPLIGYAFKREEVIKTVEELVIIITPHIVKNAKSISLKDLGYSKLNDK